MMSEQTIRRALGKLQDDPEQESAWAELQDAVLDPAAAGMNNDSLASLLESAREEHAGRHEFDAVARMLELELLLLEGNPREVALQYELVRVLNEVLDDTRRAIPALERLAKMRPDDTRVQKKIVAIQEERSRWPDLLQEMMDAADRMEGNPQAQAGILYTAAQTAYRYGLEGSPDEVKATRGVIIERLEEALELAPDRRETALLLERLYRAEGEWEKAARVLEKIALESPERETRLAAYVRLARIGIRKLKNELRGAAAYERVLELQPGHEEAMSFLVDYFSKNEQWDYLVAVYEDALKARLRPGKETEINFQIAMINWRMRNKPEAAEPYFEKIRRAEPAHPAMLTFFREFLPSRNEQSRLVQILTDAQRAMPDAERPSIATELAKLSEETQGAGKAIEHWRSVLRNDPSNIEARDSLKRLYYRTEAWPAIIDLLRHQVDRLPPSDPARVAVLKEIVTLHRDKTKQDTALVPILNQLVQLDPNDVDAVREQVRIYEALNRPRDLVTAQTRLAELEPVSANRAELWRAVARQWLEKFSNIQNAIEAYEKVLENLDGDEEATAKLRELYGKRRNFKQLYDLLGKMRARAAGDERRELGLEMAKIAAERLEKGSGAIALYWNLLEEDPRAAGVLDALEKQAERDKDFPSLARVIQFRVEQTSDVENKIKLLEKLGGLYETRIKDPQKTIDTWRQVLVLRPGYPKAIRNLREEYLAAADYDGLTEIYAQQEDWEGLADALTGAADKTEDPAQRVALSWRVARVYVDHIKRPERAARAYERILASGVGGADELRAARALEPILENESAWARLPAVYDVLLKGADNDAEKVRILGRLRELSLGPLADRASAFRYAREAWAIDPSDQARTHLETAARVSGNFEGYVEALRDRLTRLASAKKLEKIEERRRLEREVARVLATDLGRVDDAVAQLRSVVEKDEEDNDAVLALDRMLRETRRSDDLRALYELRLERAHNREERVHLLVEWAQLEEEAFTDPARALALYRRALELSAADRSALRAIARLELGSGNPEAAATALETERDLAVGTERAEREIDLARLYLGRLGRPVDALDAAVRSLDIVPHNPAAIVILEQVQAEPGHARTAARHLEREYEATSAFDKQAAALELLLQGETDQTERRTLFNRLVAVHREQRADAASAFAVVLRAVNENPDDLELWDRVGELGTITGELRRVADAYEGALTGPKKLDAVVERELCERASILLEDKLSDPDAAIPYLVRILDADPADAHAFNRLKQILTARERWDDLQKMYDRAVDSAADPHRRVDLLSEMALVFEDILDDPARAAAAYERILPIDPENETATRALDKLYARTGRFAELARLLTGRLDRVDDEQRATLENRLARLYLDKLDKPADALTQAAALLDRQIDHTDARAIVRVVLERPVEGDDARRTRVRAAEILERVYLARDEARELDEVTAIRLAETPDLLREDRLELLRRAARLRDERLANDAGALDALAELLPLDPADEEARKNLLSVGRRAGQHTRVAEVLGRAADVAEYPELKADILIEQAGVYENLLADDSRAEGVYRRILELKDSSGGPAGPQRGPALKALERIYDTRGEHDKLAEILALEVEDEQDPIAQRALLGRLGSLREGALADREASIAAWSRRLQADDADLEALEALDRLYSATGKHRELVDVLRSRERLGDDPELRRTLLRRQAETLANNLQDNEGAIAAYRTLVDDFGPDRTILAALAKLYERSGAHRDLEESLEKQLDLANESADRVALLSMMGDLRIAHLESLEAGLEAYRDALTIDPSHAPTRAALEKLLENESARADAAALLRPLYETENANDKLLAVLEIQAAATQDPIERLSILGTAVETAERGLGDSKRAFGLAARGLEEAAAMDGVRQWLERAERLAASTSAWPELVELLRKVEPEIVDGDAKLDVTLRIAELARARLNDREVSRTYYVKALDQRGDDPRALEPLEQIYEEDADWTALLDIVRRRVEGELAPEKKTALLFKQARISEENLKDPRGAIEALEGIVDTGSPPFKALVQLERLYGEVDRHQDVLGLLERQLGNAPESPPSGGGEWRSDVELHHRIGVLSRKHLGDVDRALEEFRTTLSLDPAYQPTIDELEGMMQDETLRARAAEILEPVYLARVDWRKVMQTLEVRLLDARDPEERRTLLTRIASMHEDEGGELGKALDTYARLLADDPTNEETWRELERIARGGNLKKELLAIYEGELAKIEGDETTAARLATRAGELAEQLGDADRALTLYRRAHSVDPAGRPTFDAIDRLLEPLGRADERIALYREALDHRYDDTERVALLRKIAELHRDARSDRDAAIDAFRELLEVNDRDQGALDALEVLYTNTERYKDLAELLERRADGEESPDKAAVYRLRLGNVLDEKLSDASGAVDRYEQIVQAVPTHRGAVEALEKMLDRGELKARVAEILRPLYEGSDDWRRLISLGEERLAMAEEPSEKSSILRETAKLWEERGNDKQKAFDAVRRAWALDPEDGSLRAEVDRLGEALGDWDGVVTAYEQTAAKVDDVSRPDLLRGLAELHDRRRDDPRRALEMLDKLHALDPDDLTVLDRLDRFATLLGDWPVLDRVLQKKAETAGDPTEQAHEFRRLGSLRRDMLEDAVRAIEAFERALEIEAESPATLDALIGLYESSTDPEPSEKLVDLYQRRVDITPGGTEGEELRYDLLMRRARRAETGKKDAREAIDSLQAALSVRPGDLEASRGLERLYEQEKMWPELMEAMRLRAAVVEDAKERIELRKRIAGLQARELEDPAGALEIYRQVLDEAQADEGAITAVRALGEKDENLRLTVAEILEPVLRSAGRHDDLVAILELRLAAQSDAFDRSKTLQAIARVHEEGRKKPIDAREALLRAFEEAPDDKALRDDIERVAGIEMDDSGYRAFAEALDTRAGAAFDAELVRELLVTLARVSETHLKNDARAAKALAKATEQAGDLPELLEGLDRLYGRLGQHEDLAEIIGRRIEIATEPNDRTDLRRRLAEVQIRHFGQKREGLQTLRSALEEVPDHPGARETLESLLDDTDLFEDAAEALEPVYRNANDHAKLASLFERKIDRAPQRDRTRLRIDLAHVLEEKATDPKAAQRQIERAFRDDPTEPEIMSELDRLLPITGEWREAADVIASVLDTAENLSRDQARDLWTKVALIRRERLTDDRAAEEAYIKALAHDPENVELIRTIESLQRGAGRERELVATLRRRAALEGALEEKRVLLREAHTLASTVLSDPKLAEEIIRELLKEDEANAWALEELTRARGEAKDWGEVFNLLIRRAELANNAQEQTELRHEAARVAKAELKNEPQAIELYRELLDSSEGGASDEVAVRELRELYLSAGRHNDLAELLTRRIDHAKTAGDRSRLRLELAALQRDQLKKSDDAIETLRAIIEEEPSNTQAILDLGALYEGLGRHEDLAELLGRQIERAKESGDLAQELSLRVRLGELYGTQLSDPARAITTYEGVLERDPKHVGALTALVRIHGTRGEREKQADVLHRLVDESTGEEGSKLALDLARLRAELKDDAGREKALRRALDLADAAKSTELAGKARKELRQHYQRTSAWSELAAILVVEADLEVDPEVKAAHLREAAEIHLQKREAPAEAATLLEKATELQPDDRPLLLLLCDALSASGRGKEAADVLRKVIESFGGKRSKELAVYHHRLARALDAQGERDAALQEFDLAFKIDPGNIIVLRDLGKLALDVGDLERAQKTFRALLLQKLDVQSGITKGEVFFYLGEISDKQGDKAKALQMFERAVETDQTLTRAKERVAELKGSGVSGARVSLPPRKPEDAT
jgi:tetratricopeptide (TPR) repeat protein